MKIGWNYLKRVFGWVVAAGVICILVLFLTTGICGITLFVSGFLHSWQLWDQDNAKALQTLQQHPPDPNRQNNSVENDANDVIALAHFRAGVCYYIGEGVEKNVEEAAKWFFKAAMQGNAEAQCALGFCYCNGEGVEKNATVAAFWFRQAAEQGLAEAQFRLSCCYEFGVGVTEDEDEAVMWLRKAAAQGHEAARARLGYLTMLFLRIKKDMCGGKMTPRAYLAVGVAMAFVSLFPWGWLVRLLCSLTRKVYRSLAKKTSGGGQNGAEDVELSIEKDSEIESK